MQTETIFARDIDGLIESGRLDSAAQQCSLLPQESSDTAVLWERIGDGYAGQGASAPALSAYRHAMVGPTTSHTCRVKFAVQLIQADNLPAAKAELSQVVEVAPDFAPAHMNLGTLL